MRPKKAKEVINAEAFNPFTFVFMGLSSIGGFHKNRGNSIRFLQKGGHLISFL